MEVRPFALGGNVFGWTADEKTSHQILDAYVGDGFDFIDTADTYSVWVPGHEGGESETIIGNWLKKSGKRNKVVLATKVGGRMGDGRGGLKKEYIVREAEASLKRLKTDYIDLYFTHYDDMETPVEETLAAYQDLIRGGKVRYIGISNASPVRIRESLEAASQKGLPEYVCLQPEFNLFDREIYETEYEPVADELGLGVVTYYSLASGFLTGKYRRTEDIASSPREGQLKNYMNERGQRILDALHQVADHYDATPAQIALAWLLARPSVTAPIASVSKPAQLDILKAVDIHLSQEAVIKLNEASAY